MSTDTPIKREGFSVIVVRDTAALAKHVPAWEALAANAIEPNVFYEPWTLIPAARAFGREIDLHVLFIYAPDPARPDGPALLYGVFPLERQSRWKGFPVTVLRFWRHKYCFLTTPLIRADNAQETMAAFFIWLATDPDGASLLEFTLIAGEGPFHQILVDTMYGSERLSFVSKHYTRALLRPQADGALYLQASVKGHHRRKLKRLERMLGDQGELLYTGLAAGDDPELMLRAFLEIEMAGWKGREGTALLCRQSDTDYFLDIAREAHRRGRLLVHVLQLNGSPIAMNCFLRAGAGCFYFKPTFREEYAKFSPGRLVEMETVHRLHALQDLLWVDSCTVPDNELLNSLWMERRTMLSLYVSTGRSPGEFLVSLMPLLRWFNRKLSLKTTNNRNRKDLDAPTTE